MNSETHPSERLEVNLTDPEDVAEKLPRARLVLEHRRRAANAAIREAEVWARLVENLEMFAAGLTPRPSNGTKTKEDSAVALVKSIGREMRPKEVYTRLRDAGVDIPSVAAANSLLHSAWKKGRLDKPGKGRYAPRNADQGPSLIRTV